MHVYDQERPDSSLNRSSQSGKSLGKGCLVHCLSASPSSMALAFLHLDCKLDGHLETASRLCQVVQGPDRSRALQRQAGAIGSLDGGLTCAPSSMWTQSGNRAGSTSNANEASPLGLGPCGRGERARARRRHPRSQAVRP